MKKIKNKHDLILERARLKLELIAAEERLKDDVQWIKDEFSPVKAAGKFLSNAVVNKHHGLVNDGVGFAIDKILKNVILAKSGWITKLIVPFIVKNISSNFVEGKKTEIFGTIKNIIHNARKSTANHKPETNNNHYDKSTAHEM